MMVSGVPFDAATAALARLEPVAGRMQRFGGGTRPLVVVDFAHSPDALEKTLVALKDARGSNGKSGGRLICVFGCGGDRDRGKRPLMGAVAARHADRIVLTSDNPRSEGPAEIIAQIMEGIPPVSAGAVSAEPDRVRAIEAAVRDAGAGDVVLLAGKGHEDYQEILGSKIPFSDAEQAEAALRDWETSHLQSRGSH
jgi:UDP-N-acetylmuramyl-tripeptide synthetase